MIEKVISGGQSGVDQAGLKAAKRLGIRTGGFAPRGWLVESGSAPWLASEYGLVECDEPAGERYGPVWKWEADCYKARTKRNAAEADATFWFGSGDSRGFGATANGCRKAGKPIWTTVSPKERPPGDLARLIESSGYRVINIAGNRASKSPGIEDRVVNYLCEVFRVLGFTEQTDGR